jgi:hypothetical protein
MAQPYRVEALEQDPADVLALFPDWDSHPMRGAFAQRLYQVVLGDTHRDHPFMVLGPDGPLVLSRCSVGGGTVGFYGMPLVLACRDGMTAKERRAALVAAIEHMLELAGAARAGSVLIEGKSAPDPDLIDCLCIDRSAYGTLRGHAVIDLAPDQDMLRRDVRDSYRSLINWGSRTLDLAYVNRANPDRVLFDLYPEFHAEVAGGTKRGSDYWEIYWNEIIAGRGELSLGRLPGGRLVSGTLVVTAGKTAYYASGVYDRDQFDKPLGHFPLWQAILRAKERGEDWFDLGEIFARGHASDKEVSIDFFKRGFTSRRQLRLSWSIPVG